MRFKEYLSKQEQLDEVKLRHLAATAALAAATMVPHNQDHKAQPAPKTVEVKKQTEAERLTQAVVKNWNVTKSDAQKIVDLAIKHEKAVFPKAKDILAIIGIESEFNPGAKSQLKHDPALGLMQVRPGVWGISASSLKGDIEKQIETGTDILGDYFKKLGDKDDALHAYNIGITLFNKGEKNDHYVDKYKAALQKLK